MVRALGLIEIASGEAVANGPFYGRCFAGATLIEWVVRRAIDAQLLDGVLVVADAASAHQLRGRIPAYADVYFGAEKDPLGRVAAALRERDAAAIVRVRPDCPFVDPALIDRLVTTAEAQREFDYVSFCRRDGRSAAHSTLGVFAEWCKTAAILKADKLGGDAHDRRDATTFVYTHPERFMLRYLPAPERLDRDDVRLALRDEEDWDQIQQIIDALGETAMAEEGLNWQEIASLLEAHPAIRQQMAVRNSKDSE